LSAVGDPAEAQLRADPGRRQLVPALTGQRVEQGAAARPGGLRAGDVVVAARGPDCERGQASRDISAGDQRYPAAGGGEPVCCAKTLCMV